VRLVSLGATDLPELNQGPGHTPVVAPCAPNRQRLFAKRHCFLEMALSSGDISEVGELKRYGMAVSQLTLQRERCLVLRSRLLQLALIGRHET
jgi:hypothetical protein